MASVSTTSTLILWKINFPLEDWTEGCIHDIKDHKRNLILIFLPSHFFFFVIRICFVMQNRCVQNIDVREGTVLECTFLLFWDQWVLDVVEIESVLLEEHSLW